MNMNISNVEVFILADILRLIGQPARIQILFILAQDSACVCHIEAITGIRQAAISQQLTVLRKANLVQTIREGRHIFYSLTYPEIINDIIQIAERLNISLDISSFSAKPIPNCSCPKCNPDLDPALTCKKVNNKIRSIN